MEAERWRRAKDLFDAALRHAPGERQRFLETACTDDTALLADVLSLLASFDHAGSYLEPPTAERRDLPNSNHDSLKGRRVGSYVLLRMIGQGGMGAVYLATRADQQYEKRVAIKVIRAGLDRHEIVRRFRQERQTLAALDHPHIVKLLDGGTTEEGLQFLVMEYVEGTPIDEYCDAHRLSTTERLQLFMGVCAAVQYAHQNLVVHRDLKPGNILVTADGVPKLLDFGIAKLLKPEFAVAVTRTAERPMTLQYASPEQIRGDPVTTASDVYALGVVLYQLLTGHSPYRLHSASPFELEHAICEAEPEKPSTAVTQIVQRVGPGATTGRPPDQLTPEIVSRTREGVPERLRRRLAGDLDMIVLMALRKEPQRRYASVEQFAGDLRRHLDTLPVIARKPTLVYRAAKFVRRNRLGVGAAVLLILVGLAGIVLTMRQARIAQAAQTRAERRFNDVRRLAASFLFEFHDAIQDLPGATAARQLLVKRALEYLDSLATETGDDRALQLELALAYQRVGDVQGNPNNANLGDSAGALDSYRKAQRIRELVVGTQPANLEAKRDLGITYERIGDIVRRTTGPAAALESYEKNRAINEALLAADPRNVRIRRNLSVIHNKIGHIVQSTGDLDQARNHYQQALTIAQTVLADDPTSVTARSDVAIGYDEIGGILMKTGDLEGALAKFTAKRAIYEELLKANPQSLAIRRGLIVSHVNLGDAFVTIGNLPNGVASYRDAVTIAETLVREDPKDASAQDYLGNTYASLGTALRKSGTTGEALDQQRKALAVFETLSANDSRNANLQVEFAQALVDVAILTAGVGNAGEARRLSVRGLTIARALAERPDATISALRTAATALLTCEPANLRDSRAALRYAERVVAKTQSNDPALLEILARAYFGTGDAVRALQTARQALALISRASTGKPTSGLQRDLNGDIATFETAAAR